MEGTEQEIPTRSTSSPFSGIPWTGVPADMMTTLSPTIVREQPRMLGGSGKPSKLAALAAARKAKEAAAKDAVSADTKGGNAVTSNAISLLDRLGAKSGPTTAPEPGTLSASTPTYRPPPRMSIRQKSPPASEPSPTPQPLHQDGTLSGLHKVSEEASEQSTPRPGLEELQCPPSAFAQDFSRLDRNVTPFNRLQFCTNISTSLIGDMHLFSPSGFSDPSPDAIVLQAQTKGLRLA